MLIQKAFAASAEQTQGPMAALGNFAPFIIIMVVFYFLLIRPQQKKAKKHQLAINNLKRGDSVVTAGGIIALVIKIDADSDTMLGEIADSVKVKIKKHTIIEVLTEAEKLPPKETEKKVDYKTRRTNNPRRTVKRRAPGNSNHQKKSES